MPPTTTPLRDHPALARTRAPFAKMEIEDKLAVTLRWLKQLDSKAVYREHAGSTIVYYKSAMSRSTPGHVTRAVLAPDGKHRRIEIVGFDPR